jgi:thiamine-phosphate pyrophosphorylase
VSRAGLERVQGVYALVDDDPRWRNDVRAQLAGALAGGAKLLQLRLKHSADGEALALAREALVHTRAAGALLFVNDRFDLALLAGADGVHLGQDDLAPERLPEDARARLLVGLSTHTLEQVRESRMRPIDYVAFGPIFGTRSKESEFSPRGLASLREAVVLAGRPLVAIGGITAENAAQVREAGAVAVAVISAIADASDPAEATRYLGARLLASPPGRN